MDRVMQYKHGWQSQLSVLRKRQRLCLVNQYLSLLRIPEKPINRYFELFFFLLKVRLGRLVE